MDRFPIQGVSIVLQVQGLSSQGIEGHRSSVATVGNMEPLVLLNEFSGCTGELQDAVVEGCAIQPQGSPASTLQGRASHGGASCAGGEHLPHRDQLPVSAAYLLYALLCFQVTAFGVLTLILLRRPVHLTTTSRDCTRPGNESCKAD
mmetsp:Transcript_5076/g.14166  ORF Transcript_5076/g.14166 Transcript_5076/m.14166 type:complete len:147 (-) Transcript_5076:42-482(-)